jgi:preprotein translocase subunit YajC
MNKFIGLLTLALSLTRNAFAEAAAPAQNPLLQFLPLVVVFVIFYFLMIRPQKKKFEEEQALLNKLAKGDEVYTKSGFIGTIFGINDKIVDLEVANGVRLKVLKGQIAGLAKSILETEKK